MEWILQKKAAVRGNYLEGRGQITERRKYAGAKCPRGLLLFNVPENYKSSARQNTRAKKCAACNKPRKKIWSL